MKRIAVIEDNERNLYLMKFILEKLGHKVLAARDGASGIELVKNEMPDLVILDIQLPVMDGYTVVRKLREIAETRELPVVAVTSFAMVGDREKCLAAGCTGYMEKPIDPEIFIEEIKEYLK